MHGQKVQQLARMQVGRLCVYRVLLGALPVRMPSGQGVQGWHVLLLVERLLPGKLQVEVRKHAALHLRRLMIMIWRLLRLLYVFQYWCLDAERESRGWGCSRGAMGMCCNQRKVGAHGDSLLPREGVWCSSRSFGGDVIESTRK